MKKLYTHLSMSALALALGTAAIAQDSTATNTAEVVAETAAELNNGAKNFDSDRARYSYFIGADMGKGLQQLSELYELDSAMVLEALKATLDGGDLRLNDEQMLNTAGEFEEVFNEAAMKKVAEEEAAAAEEAKQFMADNAAKEEVQVTDSGLQYKVIVAGEGDKPAETDTVKVHYIGKLLDGTVFDSSVERGEPAVFPLDQVIPGWTEGVQLMPVGSKYEFWIPSDLAYGDQGIPGSIPGGAVLNFEVELLEIMPAIEEAAEPAADGSETTTQ